MGKTHKKMKGGFLDSLTNWWNNTKRSFMGNTSTSSSYNPTQTSTSYNGSYGGKKHKKGGFNSHNGIASHASSYSGQTAQPKTIVGGRSRKHHRKGGFLGEVINQAIVPFSLLAMQQKYKKKGGKTMRHHHKKSRKTMRHRHKRRY
jgi:hypothetical protein